MKRLFFLGFCILALAGCASKKVADTLSSEIDTKPMTFDPQGSDSGKIEGLYTIHFDFDRASLNSQAKENLSKDAVWLKKHPNLKMQIEGHCDSRGSTEYNLALGDRRAKSARSYLNGLGVPYDQLSTISYGKEKPLVNGDDEESMAKNRRVNLVILEK